MGNAKVQGRRVYDDKYNFPQDIQDLADDVYAASNVMAGTSAERQAYPGPKVGLLWSETDTGELMRHAGSGRWGLVGDTGWLPITLATGWSAVAGHAPRGRRINGVVYLEGAILRGGGGAPTHLFTLPEKLRIIGPGKTTFMGSTVAQKPGMTAVQTMFMTDQGRVQMDGYTSMDGTVGWIMPISCSFVADQR